MSEPPQCLNCCGLNFNFPYEEILSQMLSHIQINQHIWAWCEETGWALQSKQTIIWAVTCGCTVREQQEAAERMKKYSSLTSPLLLFCLPLSFFFCPVDICKHDKWQRYWKTIWRKEIVAQLDYFFTCFVTIVQKSLYTYIRLLLVFIVGYTPCTMCYSLSCHKVDKKVDTTLHTMCTASRQLA